MLISQMGYIYRISKPNYKKILTEIAEGRCVNDPRLYGAKELGYVFANITDMDQQEARAQLSS